MARVQEPGSVHEMIEGALDAAGRRAVSNALSVSYSEVSRWADPDPENGRPMSVAALASTGRMFPAAAAEAAAYFAALAGGRYEPGAAGGSVGALVAAIARAAGEVTARVAEARDPEGPGGAAITDREAADIARAVRIAIEALSGLQGAVRDRAGPRVVGGQD